MQAHLAKSVLTYGNSVSLGCKEERKLLFHWNLHNQPSCWLLHIGWKPYRIYRLLNGIDKICCLQSVAPQTDLNLQCIPYSIEISKAIEHSIKGTCFSEGRSPEAINIQLNKHPTILGINSTNARKCFLYNEMNGLLRYRLYRLTNQWPSSTYFSQAL